MLFYFEIIFCRCNYIMTLYYCLAKTTVLGEMIIQGNSKTYSATASALDNSNISFVDAAEVATISLSISFDLPILFICCMIIGSPAKSAITLFGNRTEELRAWRIARIIFFFLTPSF